MQFVCPIGGAGAGLPPWHAVVHLGLTAIVVTAGVILLVAGVLAFRASAPAAGGVSPLTGDAAYPAFASRRARHTRSAVIGSSRSRTPVAAAIAFAIAAGAGRTGASAIP